MKKTFFIIIIFVIAGLILGHTVSQSHTQSSQDHQILSATDHVAQKQTASVSPSFTSSDPGIPQTISIPKINLHADVESVAMDSQGRMGVPTNPDDTAWYSPGFRPGMKGSAVIDGHLDRVTGAPAAFWNLNQLIVGDNIIVSEDNGHTYTFAVNDIEKYPYNQFPLSQVFGDADVPMLNLITCNGVWDKNSKNYSNRLVVYSKLVAEN
jgi:sortase (surface protein transpeptidase)